MKGLLFFLVLALLWGGGQALFTTLTNLSPTEISMTAYVKDRPSKKWLRLKECQLDISEATYFSSRITSEVKEVFIPVTALEVEEGEEITVLLATKDPDILKLVNEMEDLEDEAELMAFLIKNEDRFLQERDIEGVVRFGIELDDGDAFKIEDLNPNLSDDFVILDEGTRPQWGMIVMFPIGLALAWFLLFGSKKQGVAPPSSPPPLPPSGEGPPPLP